MDVVARNAKNDQPNSQPVSQPSQPAMRHHLPFGPGRAHRHVGPKSTYSVLVGISILPIVVVFLAAFSTQKKSRMIGRQKKPQGHSPSPRSRSLAHDGCCAELVVHGSYVTRLTGSQWMDGRDAYLTGETREPKWCASAVMSWRSKAVPQPAEHNHTRIMQYVIKTITRSGLPQSHVFQHGRLGALGFRPGCPCSGISICTIVTF